MRLVSVQRWLDCAKAWHARAIGHIADDVRAAAAEAGVDPFSPRRTGVPASRCNPYCRLRRRRAAAAPAGHVRGQCARSTGCIACSRARRGRRRRDRCRGAGLILWSSQSRAITCASGRLCWHVAGQHPAIIGPLRVRCLPERGWPPGLAMWCAARREDRALVARRRFIERYLGTQPVPHATPLDFAVAPPREGTPRVAPSGPGEDRDEGARAHRGLDIDAPRAAGGSLADGCVVRGFRFGPPVGPSLCRLRSWRTRRRPPLGPVACSCVTHTKGSFPANAFGVVARHINDRVKAGRHPGRGWSLGRQVLRQFTFTEIHVKTRPSILPHSGA